MWLKNQLQTKKEKLKNKNVLLIILIICLFAFSLVYLKPKSELVYKGKSNQKKLPIYSVETTEPKISISFDAAWGADDTENLLEILSDHNIKTTFFLCGYWIDKYPEEVKKIAALGHDIGNHGNTHAHSNQLSYDKNVEEIMAVHEKIKTLTGIEMNLFRPPYGEYNNTVMEALEACNYYGVQWDVDSLDWKEYGKDKLINTVLNHKNLKNGSIILFHNDAKYTPEALETIIKGLKNKGFAIVPISSLIYKDNFKMDHTGRQIRIQE